MINKLVKEINIALENNLYLLALNSALTLPDICGKAEYPQEKSSKKRYVSWFDTSIGKYEIYTEDTSMPHLTGEIVYTLRCSLLHEGNPNIQNDKLGKNQQITHFILICEKEQPFDIYSDTSIVHCCNSGQIREYRMNIRRICMILCRVAESYYKKNKNKFHFNYKIDGYDDNIEVTVDDNSYYILNDMRTDTTDSRTYGSISKSAIKGKVIFIIRRRGF